MNLVPASGDVVLQYFLPSGAVLDLQVFFNKGENTELVLKNLFESENLPCSLLPDLQRTLKTLFLEYKRNVQVDVENSFEEFE